MKQEEKRIVELVTKKRNKAEQKEIGRLMTKFYKKHSSIYEIQAFKEGVKVIK